MLGKGFYSDNTRGRERTASGRLLQWPEALSAEVTTKPTPLFGNDRGLARKPHQIIAQDSRLLLGHKESKQIGVVLLGRFRRLHAFKPKHYAVTRIVVCPANQCPKILDHLALPPHNFARLSRD